VAFIVHSDSHHELGRCGTRVGDQVVLQLSGIFLPSPEQAAARLALDDEVEGTIVEFSDSGSVPQAFAIVSVKRSVTVVVPTDRLRLVEDKADGEE